MKQTITTILAFFSITAFVYAQDLTIDSDTVSGSGLSTDFEIVVKNNITNTTSDSVNILWERVVNDLESTWAGSSVCDNNICYGANISASPTPAVVSSNRSTNLDVHFQPDGGVGTGEVIIRAWVQGDSANTVVELYFSAEARMPSSIASIDNISLKLFPNPTTDFLTIANLPSGSKFTVEAYSILGRKMLTEEVQSSSNSHRLQFGDLPKGIYMIRIYDANMNVIHAESISLDRS